MPMNKAHNLRKEKGTFTSAINVYTTPLLLAYQQGFSGSAVVAFTQFNYMATLELILWFKGKGKGGLFEASI